MTIVTWNGMHHIVYDEVYGTEQIDNPALLELLQSESLLRMNGISQGGLLDELDHPNHIVRSDHCVGVLLLLKRLGASLEEQVAGLSHDLSHTAFSHTADYAFGDVAVSDFQDKNHEAYLRKTEIPGILARHGISERVFDPERYALLEQPAPALCADRIDYTLRSCTVRGQDPSTRDECLPALAVHDGRIVFTSRIAAEVFWRTYVHHQEYVWAEPRNVAEQMLLAQAIRAASLDGTLTMDDMYQDDAHVAVRLRASRNPAVQRPLRLLERGFALTAVADEAHANLVLRSKFRYIDPAFLDKGEVCTLSETMPEYGGWFEQTRARYAKGLPVKIAPA